jgi:site-specific DNA recombinase
MQVALYARVSTPNQHQESTIASQIQVLHQYIRHQGWSLLPAHDYRDEGVSGARLDRPALDRLRDAAQRGEFDAVVLVSPDRLARNYAHQWLLIEEFDKLHIPLIFLHNPFGDTPQGKLLTQMQGMIAEYERAQILERTRRGRLEKARRGEFIPWAYSCYGYRYLPKRYGVLPQVLIDPMEADVVRSIYRALVEEHLSCRQITKRLNTAHTPTPSGKNQVWHAATVRAILTNRVYSGQARYNYRRPDVPRYRKTEATRLHDRQTGRSYRPETEWVWCEAPAIISQELFDKAQMQLQRNAELAQKMYQPASRRYLLRRLVKCGACGLGMTCTRQLSVCKKYEYLYYDCKGHNPLTCGRLEACPSRRVRADRLDQVVWDALCHLLQTPSIIPQLHQTWAHAQQQSGAALTAQQTQLLQRQQRLERQSQRLLDAYQAEIISLDELQSRRRKLHAELQHIEQERQQLARTQQQTMHWQQVITHVETFRQLLGTNLEQLAFEERQAVAQCLISKVVVTGEQVDIAYALPFALAPQVCHSSTDVSEGAPGHFYRLRLAHLHAPPDGILAQDRAGTRILEIGHDNLDSFRPIVSPFFGEYDRDFAQLIQLGLAHKDPVMLSAAVGFIGGATAIERFREVLDQITHILAVSEFARARHGKDVSPSQLLNKFEGQVGGITGIGHHDDFTHPCRGLKSLEHLTEQDILMALTLRIDCRDGDGNTKAIPTGN